MPPLSSFHKTALTVAMSQALALPLQAVTISVDTTSDAEIGSLDACTLRSAISAANTDTAVDQCAAGNGADTISFVGAANGGSITLTQGQLRVTSAVTINTSVRSAVTINGANLSRVFEIVGTNAGAAPRIVEINNLTITGGSTAGTGGGINTYANSEVTLNNIIVENNSSDLRGGGVLAGVNTKLVINNSQISRNTANSTGGGLSAYDGGIVTVNDSELKYNTATLGGGLAAEENSIITLNNCDVFRNYSGKNTEFEDSNSGGGGIMASNSTVNVNNSAVNQNRNYNSSRRVSNSSGGGIMASNSTITLNNSVVKLNQTQSHSENNDSYANGGGIMASNSTITLNDSALNQNESYSYSYEDNAVASGGGIMASNSTITLNNSVVNGNDSNSDNDFQTETSYSYGGGIMASNSIISFNNSSIIGNIAQEGAGISVENATALTLNHVTVSQNSAEFDGGGIQINDSSTVNISNSIIAGNNASSGPEIFSSSSSTVNFTKRNVLGESSTNLAIAFLNVSPAPSAATNIIASVDGNRPTTLSAILNTTPLETIIGPATDVFPDGFTTTVLPLVSGSPAIGNADMPKCPTTDQQGDIRDEGFFVTIKASNNNIALVDLGGDCDIGADEF